MEDDDNTELQDFRDWGNGRFKIPGQAPGLQEKLLAWFTKDGATTKTNARHLIDRMYREIDDLRFLDEMRDLDSEGDRELPMAVVSLRLPASLHKWAKRRAKRYGYRGMGGYMRSLIRRDMHKKLSVEEAQ